MQSGVIVAQHFQQRAPQIVSPQCSLGVEAKHERSQVAAILLQLPLAKHFHQWEELHASGTQRTAGRMGGRIVTAPHKLPYTNTETRDTSTTHAEQRATDPNQGMEAKNSKSEGQGGLQLTQLAVPKLGLMRRRIRIIRIAK